MTIPGKTSKVTRFFSARGVLAPTWITCVTILGLMITASAGAGRIERYNVVWQSPSQDASGQMPVGNGDIAAGAYVIEDDALYLLLSKNDALTDNGDNDASAGASLTPNERGKPNRVPIMKPMLIATEAEVVKFNDHGAIVWRAPSGVARDVWQLENGNILFPFNQAGSCGVREVRPSGETAWEFKLPGQYVISCQRLKDGNTLVGASCRGAVLVVSPKGEIVHSIKVRANDKKH